MSRKPKRLTDKDIIEGYVRCNKCDGYGKINIGIFKEGDMCPKCIGAGQLDWLDNAKGQRTLRGYFSDSSPWADY